MITSIADGNSPPDARTVQAAVPPPRHRRRWWLLVGLASVVLAAAIITAVALGAAYQPVGFGDIGGGVHGHMITRQVNDHQPMIGQQYLPPQPAASGGVYVSIANNGPLPVTIEAASLNAPSAQGPIDRQSEPLRDAGPATYWPATGQRTGPGRPLAGLVLRPGQHVVVRLPVRTAGCWMPANGYTVMNSFWVTEKFLAWTHVVPIWWTDPTAPSQGAIISHDPEPASQGGQCPR